MAQSFIRAARGLCSLSLYSHLLCHHLINDTITASRRCTKAKASRTPPYPACPLLPPHIPNFPFNFLPRSTPRPVPLRARAPRDPRSEAGGGGGVSLRTRGRSSLAAALSQWEAAIWDANVRGRRRRRRAGGRPMGEGRARVLANGRAAEEGRGAVGV